MSPVSPAEAALEGRHPLIVAGRIGEQQLVEGWHERETDGRYGIPYRASTGSALLVLRATKGATRLNLILSAPIALHGGPLEARLTFNRKKFELPLYTDQWVFRSFPLEITRKVLQIRVESPAVVPHHVLNNGDARSLGIFLSAVWQE